MIGRTCTLVAPDLDAHAKGLWRESSLDTEHRMWTYLSYGPFATADQYRAFMQSKCMDDDPLFFTILDGESGDALGLASYLRIDPDHGSIEVGSIQYSPRLQRTTAATETMYLMMKRVFDELGYRRYEWKCDSLNEPSRKAAERLGFQFEGIFRQATTYKNRSRDTAWFSIIDSEWPGVRQRLEDWLAPSNFDDGGRQIRPLLRDHDAV